MYIKKQKESGDSQLELHFMSIFCLLRVSAFVTQMTDILERCSFVWQSVPPFRFLCITSGWHSHRQRSYTAELWFLRVTIVAVEKQHCVLCVLLNHVSVSTMKEYLVLRKVLLWRIYDAGNNKTCRVNWPIFLFDLNEIWIFRHHIRGNPFSGSSIDTCRQTEGRNDGGKWWR